MGAMCDAQERQKFPLVAKMPKALAQTKRAAGLLLNKAAKVVR